jgi:hypothetical protein
MARTPGKTSAVCATVVPQRVQNSMRSHRLLSSERCSKQAVVPAVNSTSFSPKYTITAKALPVRRWQNVQ